MIVEFRTYTINRGMMDSYLEIWNKQIAPNHAKAGINIVGCWVNRQRNEVLWARSFEDAQEQERLLDLYEEGPDRSTVLPVASYHMAKAETRTFEDAFNPSPEPDDAPLKTPTAEIAYKEWGERARNRGGVGRRPPQQR